MKWDRLDEKPSRAFRERVFRQAQDELAPLRSVASTRWITARRTLTFGLGLAALAAVLWRGFRLPAPVGLEVAAEPELLENMEMLSRLDMLEDLDVLTDEMEEQNG